MPTKVIIGKFGKTFGVKGWIRIHSFTSPPEDIIGFTPWFISEDQTNWQEIVIQEFQQKGNVVIARPPGSTTPEIAKTYTNKLIAIDRAQFPALKDGEFYWADLIGLKVINTKNIELGKIDYLFATASNDVMVVKETKEIDAGSAEKRQNYKQKHRDIRERLIPYLKNVVLHVDLAKKIMIVDWEEDF